MSKNANKLRKLLEDKHREERQLSISYGITERAIVVQFNAEITNLMMSVDECDAMITKLGECKAAFQARKAA